LPVIQAAERVMAAQLNILGNSVNYNLTTARSMIDGFSREARPSGRRARPVSPEMMQAMGIPIEIEYVGAPSA